MNDLSWRFWNVASAAHFFPKNTDTNHAEFRDKDGFASIIVTLSPIEGYADGAWHVLVRSSDSSVIIEGTRCPWKVLTSFDDMGEAMRYAETVVRLERA